MNQALAALRAVLVFAFIVSAAEGAIGHALAQSNSSAPPCRSGAKTCQPWERAWNNSNKPVVGATIMNDGRMIAPSNIPDGAIKLLRSKPSLAPQFDEKYGVGAAREILRSEKSISTTDDQIRQAIIQQSIANYSGSCPCPYNVARNGSMCGRRSAYSRPGGASPMCYPADVPHSAVEQYKRLNR